MANMTDPRRDGLWTPQSRPFRDDYAWIMNWARVIRELAKLPYPPKYVVLNAGLWPHDLADSDLLDRIVEALRENGMIGIYKTTTALSSEVDLTEHLKIHTHEHAMCAALRGCLNLTYTVNMSEPAEYWDARHFQPIVNRRFNEELFSLIQDLEEGASNSSL